ncbi:O-antigen ligase family protein [Candidatus Uhrbacteria bacterium]|nr:O-antigen ligase family protein [Candidatus Uhrbacteria bacterium]
MLWIALFVDIGAFIAAQSRGALLGVAVGIVVFSGMWVLLSKNKKAKAGVVIAMVAFFSLYGLAYSLKEQPFIKETPMYRLLDLQATTETRFIAWKIAWNGFLERPLTGWGYDNFHILFNKKYNPESLRFGYYETWFDRAHNTVMDTLAMTGLGGILTYISIWAALFYSVFRAYRKGWIDAPFASVLTALPIAYFVQNLFVFDQPAGFTMSFFMYGFIIVATSGEFVGKKEKDDLKIESEKGGSFPAVSFALIQLVALVIVWHYSITPFRISKMTIESNNYFASGLLQQSFDLAKKAASLPTPYLDEQTFLQSRNLMSIIEANALSKVPIWKEWYALVKDITDRHLAEHPNNTHPHFIYARFLQAFAKAVPEDAALAEAEYLKAIDSSPTRQQLYFSLARLYLEQGKKQQAFDEFKKAADLDPEVGESLWYAGLTQMFDLGQMDAGAKLVAQSIKVKAPYVPKDMREATALAVALSTVSDVDDFKKLMTTLSTLANGTAPLYLDIARSAEKLGLIQERNDLVNALLKADPSLTARLSPLQNGTATSINDALMMTANVTTTAPVPTTTSKAPETPPPTNSTPSLATSSASSAGPRLRH